VEGVDLEDIRNEAIEEEMRRVYAPLLYRTKQLAQLRPYDFEQRLQKILERYAGGASTFYEMNEERLMAARKQLARLPEQFPFIEAHDLHDLMLAHSVMDRVDVAQILVEHLIARKETRWPGYQTRLDYPGRDDEEWSVFVNSRRDPATGKIEVFTRPYEQIIPGSRYEG
jgi:adenylylsulfate reductase subunit A